MLNIQQILVEDSIPTIHFACDIGKCRGACCTMEGGLGAPLLYEELKQLENSYPIVKHYLPKEHIDTITQFGLYESRDDTYTTVCYNNKACVFVTYENDIAYCSIEKAYKEGMLDWQKPISCHLFPIRMNIRNVKYLHYERISECQSALYHGKCENKYLVDFLKEPLIRTFGQFWYDEFYKLCQLEQKKMQFQSFSISN